MDFKEFSDLFESLGCMDGLSYMEVNETVRPVVHPPRNVHRCQELVLVGETRYGFIVSYNFHHLVAFAGSAAHLG